MRRPITTAPRRAAHRVLALALALSGLTACSDAPTEADDDTEFPGWGSKEDQIGASLTVTHDATAQIFDGYNRVVDAAIRRNCVLPRQGGLALADFRAGGDVISTELSYLSSRKQLEQALDIDAQAKLALGPLSGSAQLDLGRSFRSSERTVSILLRSRHMYSVVNQQAHALTDEALATLHADPDQFTRECGTDYIAGVAHGAELVMLIQIEAGSVDEKLEVESKLAAAGIRTGPASLDASLGTKFATALADESADVAVHVRSRGFVPSVDLAALANLDADAFAVAAQAQTELRASVERDKCHDQGDGGPGVCGDAPARGYLGNGARAAVTMGILRQQFQRTGNFPSTAAIVDAMLAVARGGDEAVAMLEDHAALYDAVLAIHADEAGAMVGSDRPFDFGIYDTTSAMREDFTYDEWVDHASAWADVFSPDDGDAMDLLADALAPCWSRAEFGDFRECTGRPQDTVQGADLLALLAEYAEARVRPVSYAASDVAVRHGDAATVCANGWRPATRVEASRLFFAVDRNPAIPAPSAAHGVLGSGRAAWYDDGGHDCAAHQGAWIERAADGTFATGCYGEGGLFSTAMRLPALCVPPSGVWGSQVPGLPQ